MRFLPLVVLALASIPGPSNLISNGDMEAFSETSVSGWSIQKPDDASGTVQSVQSPVKSGKRALLLRGQGAWMSASSSPIAIRAATSSRASAWIRTKKGHARIQINHWRDDKWLGASDGVERITKDEWQQVSVQSDPKKFPEANRLSVGVVSDGPEVEVYVDDVVMIAR